MHTTNYYNTFIQVADDCPVTAAEVPPQKAGREAIAGLQHEMLAKNPYKYTSDDVVFGVFALRKDISQSDLEAERTEYFSKGRPCLRSSPLGKRYGFGMHHDAKGTVALYAIESDEYKTFAADEDLKQIKAMRSKRA